VSQASCRLHAGFRDAAPGNRIALAAMDATAPPAGNLYLVVGYDGSHPAIRALDAAVRLLHGRVGSIEVVYVAHLPSIDMLSPGAVTEMEASFDDIARELHTAASEQLRDHEERWRFERREGLIADELIAVAAGIRDAHPGDNVAIVVGSSSHAMHRVVGSVAVNLARRSAVPLVVVP
jgi:nucleotide-binding universal stress UspA family protein